MTDHGDVLQEQMIADMD